MSLEAIPVVLCTPHAPYSPAHQWREDALRSLRHELAAAEGVGASLSDDLVALLTSTEGGKKRDPYTGNARARKDGIVQKKWVHRLCIVLMKTDWEGPGLHRLCTSHPVPAHSRGCNQVSPSRDAQYVTPLNHH